jgi:lysylphosphatidylglycerol synthetase-like protein (DUF2156 family)
MEETTQRISQKPSLPIKTKIAAWWMIVISGIVAASILTALTLQGKSHTVGIEVFLCVFLPLSLIHLSLGFSILKRKKRAWWSSAIMLLLETVLILWIGEFSIQAMFYPVIFVIPFILLLLDRKNFFKIAT